MLRGDPFRSFQTQHSDFDTCCAPNIRRREHAQSRLGESLQNEKCGNQLFHILNMVPLPKGCCPWPQGRSIPPTSQLRGTRRYFSLIMDPLQRKTYCGGGWMHYGTFGTTKLRNCEPTRLKPVCNGKLQCWNRVWSRSFLMQPIGILGRVDLAATIRPRLGGKEHNPRLTERTPDNEVQKSDLLEANAAQLGTPDSAHECERVR
jgi:hypothetical protein